jgi:hypothetical protein
MRILGADVVAGQRPLIALSVVVGVAVLREGSEIVLFLYGRRRIAGRDLLALGRRAQAGWIKYQQGYYEEKGPKYELMHLRAERVVEGLFLAVLWAAAIELGITIVISLFPVPHPPHVVDIVIVVAGVVGPAVAAALHGLASQLEVERLAHNYAQMDRALQRLWCRFDDVLERVPQRSHAETLERLEELAREAARVMLTEVDDWHAAARVHSPSL